MIWLRIKADDLLTQGAYPAAYRSFDGLLTRSLPEKRDHLMIRLSP